LIRYDQLTDSSMIGYTVQVLFILFEWVGSDDDPLMFPSV
jgi:hypothetical protein